MGEMLHWLPDVVRQSFQQTHALHNQRRHRNHRRQLRNVWSASQTLCCQWGWGYSGSVHVPHQHSNPLCLLIYWIVGSTAFDLQCFFPVQTNKLVISTEFLRCTERGYRLVIYYTQAPTFFMFFCLSVYVCLSVVVVCIIFHVYVNMYICFV